MNYSSMALIRGILCPGLLLPNFHADESFCDRLGRKAAIGNDDLVAMGRKIKRISAFRMGSMPISMENPQLRSWRSVVIAGPIENSEKLTDRPLRSGVQAVGPT